MSNDDVLVFVGTGLFSSIIYCGPDIFEFVLIWSGRKSFIKLVDPKINHLLTLDLL